MLHKLKSTYGEIAKYFPELTNRLSPSAHKKQILLEMARRGVPKPRRKTEIGRAFGNYTLKKSTSYDPAFTKQIGKIAPDWLVRKPDQNKAQLLEMAGNKTPRPRDDTKLGRSLYRYTSKKSNCYDPIFEKKIKRLAPHWFFNQSDMKKIKIIEILRKGLPRPNWNTELGRSLYKYINIKCDSYDPSLTKQIRKLAPLWLFKQSDRANQKRQRLIKMARKGLGKPKCGTELRNILNKSTSKKSASYNPDFDKQIRKLAPIWFVHSADENKKELIKMARKGVSRPNRRTKIGEGLSAYTRVKSKSYDPVFTKQIKKLAPHWFKRCSIS